MNKDLLNKIMVQHSAFDRDDLSADEKKNLRAAMLDLGMTESTVHVRFFDKGFAEWEIKGINQIKKDFLETYREQFWHSDHDDDGNPIDSGYAAILAMSDADGAFYAALKNASLVTTFKKYMYELGMAEPTTYKRFSTDEWKEWELQGIENIMQNIEL